MNEKARNCVEHFLNEPIKASKIGFLLVENFERVPYGKWPFLESQIYVAEFNREKALVEKIDGEELNGGLTPERVKRFIALKNPDSKIYPSHQLLWTCEQLSKFLLVYEKTQEVMAVCKTLEQETFTPTELTTLCKRVNEINTRQYKKANERAVAVSRAA